MRGVLCVLLILFSPLLAGCVTPADEAEGGIVEPHSATPPATNPSPTPSEEDPQPPDAGTPPTVAPPANKSSSGVEPNAPTGYVPRVVVGVPDSGINPYHRVYYRPTLTEHPCTFLEGFPCSVERLELTLGGDDYAAAVETDRAKWESLVPGKWYWIPRTVFVAVSCGPEASGTVGVAAGSGLCVLDDTSSHGTGTTSSIVTENPDALIAFRAHTSDVAPFLDAGIPVDLFSVSWSHRVPVPSPFGTCPSSVPDVLFVLAGGNDPRSTTMDCWAGNPAAIAVGGAYARDGSEEAFAAKHPDVVSYYCRATADSGTVDAMRESYCGTSFAAPTVAGALSKVVLGLRRESGYTGSTVGGFVDPVLGVTVADLRAAMNRTASYAPEAQYPHSSLTGVPVNPAAPWLQWGWGFFDGLVADATLAHLLGRASPEKAAEAVAYMEATYAVRTRLYDG